MTAPTGSIFPGALDSTTIIGTAVASGNPILASYANLQSSAIINLETAMGPNPGVGAWKPAVRLATAAALPSNTYSGGAQTLTATGNAALSIDSVAVAVNDRILVKNESTQTNNGIYVVTTAGDGSHAYVLTRATDYNLSSSIPAASVVAVSEGSTQTHTLWMLTTSGIITLDTSYLTYAQLTGFTYGNSPVRYGTGAGSANAYTLTVSPSPGAYAAGQVYLFSPTFSNTGAATLNVNSLGAKSITQYGTNALVSGDILSSQMALLVYDGTQFQLISPGAIVPTANGGTGTAAYTKGNILAGNGSSTLSVVSVGSNNQVLTADSTQTAGVKWAAPKIGVEQGGTLESTEPNINFIAGNNMSVTVADNSGASRADITITNSGGTTVGAWGAFLDGSDGSVTFDGTTTILGMAPVSNVYTLSRNIMPSSMTVNSGVTINTASFIIFVQGTLTNDGTIACNGNNASGATGGAAVAGSAGYVSMSTRAGGTGSAGNTSVASSAYSYGGAGGAGGNGSPYTGGSGDSATPPSALHGGLSVPRMWGAWMAGSAFAQVPATLVTGGGAGCGGAGDGSHAGGGGGTGGVWVIVCARTLTGTGTFSANGGNGAAGTAGNSGGGGGGGGGVVSLFYESLSNGLTIQANGGTGGLKSGTGSTNGSNGSAGNIFTISCS